MSDPQSVEERLALLERGHQEINRQLKENHQAIIDTKVNTETIVEWINNAKFGAKIIVKGSAAISFVAKIVSAILFLIAVYVRWKTGKFPGLETLGDH